MKKLRILLLLLPSLASASPDLDGVWSSAFGDITLVTQGKLISGSYSNGRKLRGQYDVKTGVLRGYWLSQRSSNPCKTLKYGTRNWGQFEWMFSEGEPPYFSGRWGYCEQMLDLKWKGKLKKANPKLPPPAKPPEIAKKPLSPEETAQRALMNSKRSLALAKAALEQLNACYAEAQLDNDIATLCEEVYNARLDNFQAQQAVTLPAKITHDTWNQTQRQHRLSNNQLQLEQLDLALSCIDKGAAASMLSQCIADKGEFTPSMQAKPTKKSALKSNTKSNTITNPLLQGYKKGLTIALPKYRQAVVCYQSAKDLPIANLCKNAFFEAKRAEDDALNQAMGISRESKTFVPHKTWDDKKQKTMVSRAQKGLEQAQWAIVCIDKGATLFSVDACIANQGRLSGGT